MSTRTATIYGNFKEFIKHIGIAFGTIDKKSQAKQKIKTIRQKGSASSHGAEFLQIALKLL
jgi:hypothetical protein